MSQITTRDGTTINSSISSDIKGGNIKGNVWPSSEFAVTDLSRPTTKNIRVTIIESNKIVLY